MVKYLEVFVICCFITFSNAVINLKHALVCENDKLSLNCHQDDVIHILDGNYGRTTSEHCTKGPINNVTCIHRNTASILSDFCEGKPQCIIDAKNDVFGDPCVGNYKYLYVLYQCTSKTEFKHAVACENKFVDLDCDPGKIIQISTANYGRTSKKICPQDPIKTTYCNNDNTYNVMSEMCNQKQSCVVSASNSIFGDSCVGTVKYLSVKYRCVVGKENRQTINKQCENGDLLFPSQICDGKNDCLNGEDEQMCTDLTKNVCEHKKLELKCQKGEFIKISSGYYGRVSHLICPQSNLKSDMNCKSENSFNIIKNSCNGKEMCEIHAHNRIFGDPCRGTVKYLNVRYRCVQTEGSHDIVPRSIKYN